MPHLGTTIGGIEYIMPLIPASGDVLFHYQINTTTAFEHGTDVETGLSGNDACKILLTWSFSIDWSNSASTYQHIFLVEKIDQTYTSCRLFQNKGGSLRLYTLNGTVNTLVTNAGSGYAEDVLGNCEKLSIGPRRTPKEIVYFHYLDVWIWK